MTPRLSVLEDVGHAQTDSLDNNFHSGNGFLRQCACQPAIPDAHPESCPEGARHDTSRKETFDVKVVAQADDRAGDQSLGRLTIDKQFHGDLEGTSVGQMLSGGNPATGSGGYVAMEKVTGTLQGKSGSFILQHSGTMDKGAFELNVFVVPGSGTGDLKGIAGKLTIKITDGKHFYEFDYTLPETH